MKRHFGLGVNSDHTIKSITFLATAIAGAHAKQKIVAKSDSRVSVFILARPLPCKACALSRRNSGDGLLRKFFHVLNELLAGARFFAGTPSALREKPKEIPEIEQ